MSAKNVTGLLPEAVIVAHRRGPEFVAAILRGDRTKAQRVLARILGDKDGQTAWHLTQAYADDPAAFGQLQARFGTGP